MSSSSQKTNLVSCTIHGEQRSVFACKHILLQLDDGHPRGAIWSFDQDDNSFSMYCNACDLLLTDDVEEIPPEIEQKMEPKLICEKCMDRVLKLNGLTRFN